MRNLEIDDIFFEFQPSIVVILMYESNSDINLALFDKL